jgi:FkbM family methyltransferase
MNFFKKKILDILRRKASELRKSNINILKSSNVVCFGYEPVTDLIGFYGAPEFSEFKASIEFLKNNRESFQVAIDVGANIGVISQILSEHFEKVFAFEPNPQTFKLLELNASYCLNNNVIPYNQGLSSKKCELVLTDWNPFHSGQSKFNVSGDQLNKFKSSSFKSRNYKVPCNTLDDFVLSNNIQKVSLIKIDVEGHEQQVLMGARNVIEEHSPAIIFEDWDTKKGSKSSLRLDLEELGYLYFWTLEQQYDNPISGSKWWSNIINWTYRLFVISIYGDKMVLVNNHLSKLRGYEHVLAIKKLN